MQPSSERVDADPTRGELFTDRLVGEDHGPEQDSRLQRPDSADNLAMVMVRLPSG